MLEENTREMGLHINEEKVIYMDWTDDESKKNNYLKVKSFFTPKITFRDRNSIQNNLIV